MAQDLSGPSKPQSTRATVPHGQDALDNWGGIWNKNRLLSQMKKKNIARDRTLAQLGTDSWNSWNKIKNLEVVGNRTLGQLKTELGAGGCLAGDRIFGQLGTEWGGSW